MSNCSNTMIMINNFFDSRKEQKLLYYYRLSYIQFCHHQVFKESIQSFCYISVQWLFIMESFFCLGVSKNHISHRYKCWWSVTAWVLYINIIPVMITFFCFLLLWWWDRPEWRSKGEHGDTGNYMYTHTVKIWYQILLLFKWILFGTCFFKYKLT